MIADIDLINLLLLHAAVEQAATPRSPTTMAELAAAFRDANDFDPLCRDEQ